MVTPDRLSSEDSIRSIPLGNEPARLDPDRLSPAEPTQGDSENSLSASVADRFPKAKCASQNKSVWAEKESTTVGGYTVNNLGHPNNRHGVWIVIIDRIQSQGAPILLNDVPLNVAACVDEDSPPKSCRPTAVLDILDVPNDEVCPRLIHRNSRKCLAFPHNNLGAPRPEFARECVWVVAAPPIVLDVDPVSSARRRDHHHAVAEPTAVPLPAPGRKEAG